MNITITKYPVDGPVTHMQVRQATLRKIAVEIGAETTELILTPTNRQLLVDEDAALKGLPINPVLTGLFGHTIYGDGVMVDADDFGMLEY